jgi:hypothetical protein
LLLGLIGRKITAGKGSRKEGLGGPGLLLFVGAGAGRRGGWPDCPSDGWVRSERLN